MYEKFWKKEVYIILYIYYYNIKYNFINYRPVFNVRRLSTQENIDSSIFGYSLDY